MEPWRKGFELSESSEVSMNDDGNDGEERRIATATCRHHQIQPPKKITA